MKRYDSAIPSAIPVAALRSRTFFINGPGSLKDLLHPANRYSSITNKHR